MIYLTDVLKWSKITLWDITLKRTLWFTLTCSFNKEKAYRNQLHFGKCIIIMITDNPFEKLKVKLYILYN